MINLYDKNCVSFNNNGIGPLKDTIKCEVTEELNGELTVDFEYPKNQKYSDNIDNDMIIKVDTGENERQLFRIKNYKENIKTITATPQHISYDLIDNALDDTFPQNLNGAAAIDWILSHTQYDHNFTGYSDITKQASARYVRKNPIQAIIGDIDNSFVSVWGGELERDNFTIKMLKHRGEDKGFKIKYRKNLTGIEFTKDDSSVITRVRPIGYNGIMLPEKYIDSPIINNYPHPRIGEIEYSDIKLKENPEDEEGYNTLEECYTEMRKRAALEYSENNIDKPIINVKVDFVDLSQTTLYEDYKILTKAKLGDTVTVILDNMQIKLRVIRTTYDSLSSRFLKLELGEFKANYITDTDKNIQNAVKKETNNISTDILSQAQNKASELIMKATTGYVVLRPADNPTEILIMNTADVNTASKIWRWNMNGFAYSSNGINGPYGTAITMDGAIVADFITAGILSANLIKAGTMSLSRLYGDVLTLGGNNNISGKIQIKDAAANIMAILDSNGLTLQNGAKLFGGNGVLSNFKYESVSSHNDFLGFYDTGDENLKTQLRISAYIPNNFVISSAIVTLIHAPVSWTATMNNTTFWGYCKNIKLYKVTNQNYTRSAYIGSNYYDNINDYDLLNISNAFGTNGFTANVPSSANHSQQIVNSIDVKNYLSNRNNMLVLQSSNNAPKHKGDFIEKEAFQQTGQAIAILNVVGYMK